MSEHTPGPVPAPAPGRANGSGEARPSRAEKAAATRRALIEAAAAVIGEHGYADATVARITARANVAQGTFYNYFASRQDLFDTLLPEVGLDVMDYVGERISGSADTYEMEERGFRAFFEYLAHNPGFFRILNEAETMAPDARRRHFDNLTERYVAALKQGRAHGDLPGYGEDELEALVYLLMAARSYLALRYGQADGRLPEKVVRTYVKFFTGGLRYRAE